MAEIDPRDDVIQASRAFSGVVDLVDDANRGGGFEATGPDGLHALLDLIRDKLGPAAEALQAYVPRK